MSSGICPTYVHDIGDSGPDRGLTLVSPAPCTKRAMEPNRRMPGWIARRDREAVAIAGSVVLPDGRSLPVTIRDLSPEGCRIECEETLPIAATVVVDLGGSTVRGHVRWALGREAGLQLFD